MSSSNFQDELRNLEKSIQEDDEWTALKSLHRVKLVEFLKVSETLVANIDKMFEMWEMEIRTNGATRQMQAMGNDMQTDASVLSRGIALIGQEMRRFTERTKQLKKNVRPQKNRFKTSDRKMSDN